MLKYIKCNEIPTSGASIGDDQSFCGEVSFMGGIMINERIILSDDGRASLDTYVTFNTSGALRRAVLICPGGGYHGVSPREAEPIALAFAAKGYNVNTSVYTVEAAKKELLRVLGGEKKC